jgi:hypothetical protein
MLELELEFLFYTFYESSFISIYIFWFIIYYFCANLHEKETINEISFLNVLKVFHGLCLPPQMLSVCSSLSSSGPSYRLDHPGLVLTGSTSSHWFCQWRCHRDWKISGKGGRVCLLVVAWCLWW